MCIYKKHLLTVVAAYGSDWISGVSFIMRVDIDSFSSTCKNSVSSRLTPGIHGRSVLL